MNRVLYQLSYAAIGQIPAKPKSALLLYPPKWDLSRENVCIFQHFFGNAEEKVKWSVKDREVFKVCGIIFPWWQRLCGAGIVMAGLEPRVYVSGRGQCLFTPGKTGKAPVTAIGESGDRSCSNYFYRIYRRVAVQPAIHCVGLPGTALESSWTDLPAFFTAVDPGGGRRDASLSFYREKLSGKSCARVRVLISPSPIR